MRLQNVLLLLAFVPAMLNAPAALHAQANSAPPIVENGPPPKAGKRNNYIIAFDLITKKFVRVVEYSDENNTIYETDIAGVVNVGQECQPVSLRAEIDQSTVGKVHRGRGCFRR